MHMHNKLCVVITSTIDFLILPTQREREREREFYETYRGGLCLHNAGEEFRIKREKREKKKKKDLSKMIEMRESIRWTCIILNFKVMSKDLGQILCEREHE
jgi:hypothetical protein